MAEDVTMPSGFKVVDDAPSVGIPEGFKVIEQEQQAPELPFTQGVESDLKQRGVNLAKFALDPRMKVTALPFKYALESGGALGDVVVRGLNEVVPEPIQELTKAGIDYVAGLGPVQAVAKGAQEFSQQYPNAAATLFGGLTMAGAPATSSLASRPVQAAVSAPKRVGESLLEKVKLAFSNKPIEEPRTTLPISQTEQALALGDVVNKGSAASLLPGAKTQDFDLMREEALARSGVLGGDIEKQVRQADKQFEQSVKNTVQALAGTSTGPTAQDTLSNAMKIVKRRRDTEQKVQNRLMEQRNNALAKAKLYSDYTNETLGATVRELKETPDFVVNLPKKGVEGIKDDLAIFDKLTSVKNGEIKAAELAAWRTGLNNYKPGDPNYSLAKPLKGVYDDWVDNQLQFALKEGDEDLAHKILNANKRYSEFKTKYGTDTRKGQARAVENLLTQEEMTPRKMVNSVFGASLKGNDNTEQFVKRLIQGSKEGAERQKVAESFRAGLYQRAFESAFDETNEFIKIGKLINNLIEMQKSDSYRKYLSTPEHDKVTKSLIEDLGKYQFATTNKDIVNLSGTAPMMTRIMQATGSMPIVRNIALARGSAEAIARLAETGSKAGSRRQVEKSIAEFYNELSPNIERSIKLDLSKSLGGTGLGLTVNEQTNEEMK